MNGFLADGGRCSGEFEFPRDDGSGEVAFTNKVWHNVDGLRVHHVENLAEAGLLFPESAVHFLEMAAIAERCGVIESGGAGVWVLGGAVSDDDESRVFGVGHGGRVRLGEGAVGKGIRQPRCSGKKPWRSGTVFC